jgi:branched-chain amino acid aminotransferase
MTGSAQRLEFSTTISPNPVPAQRRAEILADPGFGLSFADHMVTSTWTPDEGWHDAGVRPYATLSLDPATAVLHYAQAIF